MEVAAPYFRNGYLSKASTVNEDHSKSSDDEARICREPDINDTYDVVEGEPRHEKEPNVTSAMSLANAQKRNGSSQRVNHEKDASLPKQEPAKKR